jgi:hypothetical protein
MVLCVLCWAEMEQGNSSSPPDLHDAWKYIIGFVGAPFTLASHTIDGKSSKHCLAAKKIMKASL